MSRKLRLKSDEELFRRLERDLVLTVRVSVTCCAAAIVLPFVYHILPLMLAASAFAALLGWVLSGRIARGTEPIREERAGQRVETSYSGLGIILVSREVATAIARVRQMDIVLRVMLTTGFSACGLGMFQLSPSSVVMVPVFALAGFFIAKEAVKHRVTAILLRNPVQKSVSPR
jgi:hypothetical protein